MAGHLLHGSCYCGSVRFSVEDAFIYAFYCHCSRCRRRTGSAFAAIGGIESHKLQITSGQADTLKVGENAGGYFCLCKQCFSPLFSMFAAQQRVHLQLGTLESAPSLRPAHHIFVGSKAPWHEISDALPRFEELPSH
jgi:hypothetical protein